MLKKIKSKKAYRRKRIHFRIRRTLAGRTDCPRLSVFRSNKDIYVQLIDDSEGKTLASSSSREKEIQDMKGNKSDKAAQVGKAIAAKAREIGIEQVVFDRGGYLYHGRIKSLADGAREGGLKF
jgi:large subunit ribosomal protein L18